MATVQNIIDRAAQRSNLNDSALIDSAELIAYVSSFEQNLYLDAAKENPDYFGLEGNTAARGASTDTWAITATPGNIAAVSGVEVAAITGTVTGVSVGTEIEVVGRRNPDAGIAPRVYIRNRTIHEYNSELQDDASNFVTQLKLFYSFLPSVKTATSDSLDLPDEFNDLLILPLARVMAIRDQRPDEVGVLDQEYVLKYNTFINQVSVFDEAAVREIESIPASSRATDQ